MRTSSRLDQLRATGHSVESHPSRFCPQPWTVDPEQIAQSWSESQLQDLSSQEIFMKGTLQTVVLSALLLTGATSLIQAQTSADSGAIRATALDYIDGWYTNNAARMERALHPHLAKRLVWADSTGRSHQVDMTALELI
jgi:hypothetical protein